MKATIGVTLEASWTGLDYTSAYTFFSCYEECRRLDRIYRFPPDQLRFLMILTQVGPSK